MERIKIIIVCALLCGCASPYPLQSGGSVRMAPELVEVVAPENSSDVSEVHVKLAKNQKDYVRQGQAEAVKIQANRENERLLYWFGGGFVLLGLLCIAFKNWLPFIGIKLPVLSIGLGVCLMLLPLAMQDVLFRLAILGVCGFVVYALARKYDVV